MKDRVSINGRIVGSGYPPMIVAELSANHNGSLERAMRSLETAKASGADAVKLQTYRPETMTIRSQREEFQLHGGLWDGYNLFDLYQEAQTPYEWHGPLFEKAASLSLTIFSTPFDESAVELLEALHVPAYKIASFELTDLPLIDAAARTGKPLILSTGMGTVEEIGEAVESARRAGCQELVLLHCTSAYPSPESEVNLSTIPDLQKRFGVPVGLSDHTLGLRAALGAVALGACMIEKHFTLSRKDPGPDAAFSIEPEELKTLCSESRAVWKMIGAPNYELTEAEKANMPFRRSIYSIKDIREGETFSTTNIQRIRPGCGLAPKHYPDILGRRAACNISSGTPLMLKLVQKNGDTADDC